MRKRCDSLMRDRGVMRDKDVMRQGQRVGFSCQLVAVNSFIITSDYPGDVRSINPPRITQLSFSLPLYFFVLSLLIGS